MSQLRLASISIRVKLVGSFLLLTLMLAVIAGYGYYEMGQISAEVRDVIEGPIASITLGRSLESLLDQYVANVRKYVTEGDTAARDGAENDKAAIEELLTVMAERVATEEERALVDRVRQQYESVVEVFGRAAESRLAGHFQIAVNLANQTVLSPLDQTRRGIVELLAIKEGEILTVLADADEAIAQTRGTSLIVGAVAVLIAVLLCIVLPPAIVGPVVAVARAANLLAEGDLTAGEIAVKTR